MARIYLGLAGFAMLMLSISLILGLIIGDFNGMAREVVAAKQASDKQGRGTDAERKETARSELAAVAARFTPVRQRATLHKLVGIAATLVAVLVHSISVTYFIGTARWCQEVVLRYSLPEVLAQRSVGLKRRSFPWSLGGIVLVLVTAALGGASDPGANFQGAARWVTPHLVLALGCVALSGWSYLKQVQYIHLNLQAIEAILAEVQRIRQERGWDAQATAGPSA